MCVRYVLHRSDAAIAAIEKALGVKLDPEDWMSPPRYNVAPSQKVPVVSFSGKPALTGMRWGMIPPADRLLPKRRLLTNARAETLTHMPAFRGAAAARRCLVPANGFYEFKDMGRRKDPYLFTRPDDAPFAFAGLWEPPVEGDCPSFCILTTEPNARVAPFHNRMPVFLTDETYGQWLGEAPLEEKLLGELCRPPPAETLVARRVNSYVNNSRHEGPECLAPPEEELPELF